MVYIEEFRVASFQLRLKCNNALSWSFFFSVPADTIPGEKEDGGKLFPKWLIAVIAGVAGVFVLAILVLCLCCLKLRRKKANGADKANKHPTSSYVVGGPDVAPATEGLRYGRESIEDDPFIVAASIQSLNSIDRKKEKQAPCVNYGYLSEDQPEMLLNPGSRLSKNGLIAHAGTGENVNSAYPASGPQRDFKTFGASYEIVGTAKHNPIDNPLYTTADQRKPVPKSGASSSSSKTNSPVKEPLDSTVPYATPQKKNKPKKSRKDPQEITTSEPPPKYTLEDRSPEEPMPGDLDLDDPRSLPPTERPPHLPPPVAMTLNKRTKPSNYHGDSHDRPTEGPRFFYIPDNRDRRGSDRAKIPSPSTGGKEQVQTEFGTYSS
ncbi:uncharacterized protein LOC110039847 [Orbicella faveolata]|uniref:uncharacterized protein LOC110039847 n=1 Tax=Orbicella faveolata TaxID=48498 RepID=UPI0009E5F40D|nr:uncharacterized protein LOC110039847 [Orbicella faveolata]